MILKRGRFTIKVITPIGEFDVFFSAHPDPTLTPLQDRFLRITESHFKYVQRILEVDPTYFNSLFEKGYRCVTILGWREENELDDEVFEIEISN